MLRPKQPLDRPMFWRIALPALVTFTVFAVLLFFVMFPFIESRLMAQKRNEIRELVAVVLADLAHHAKQEAEGALSPEEAQHHAIEHVRALRYGLDGKDYFWINDMQCRMVMHPYQVELEGEDASDLVDPNGFRIVVEAVNIVQTSGAGYMEYMWQWKDDPNRVVPKVSYVRAFEPWGWVVGTGVYIGDVRKELADTRRALLLLCGAILLLVSLLCALLIWETHRINERRREAEQEIRDREETFRALAEGSVDAVMRFDLDHRHLYASPAVEQMTGIPPEDFIGKTHAELGFPSELVALWSGALDDVIRSGTVHRTEFRLPNGIWLDWALVPEFDARGEVRAIVTSARDVSERKQAEQELQKEKRFSETVLESLPGVFYVYRMDGDTARLVRFNRNHAVLTGYTDQELLQMTPADYFEGEEAATALRVVQETLEQGESRARLHLISKDGSRTPCEFTSRRLETGDGELHFVGVGIDISDSLAAQEALRESEERYHSLFESANDAIFVWKDARVAMCNAKTLDLFGCTCDEMIGSTPYRFSPPRQPDGQESQSKAMEKIEVALRGEPQRFEWVHRRHDGTLFDAEIGLNSFDLGGETCVLAVVRDVTERKRTESELKQSALVIEQTSEMVVITDTSGTITYVNPAFERVTGYTRDEAIGQNPRMLKSGEMDPSVYRDLWETILRGETWTGRLVNKRKDGALLTEDATITPLRSASDEVVNYVAVERDVSRELELEEQFFQAQKMEAVGQLAGGVAHDFNNLLQVILGYGGLALEEREAEDETEEMLTEVMDAANRATTLVRQLLAFSRRQVLELETMDLAEVVNDMAKMIRRVIGAHIAFNIHSEPGLMPIRADKGQVEQVLMNLCVNARDSMAEGGTLTVETSDVGLSEGYCAVNTWAKPGRYAQLSVSDTGCGMDAATQKRIFEPFFTTKEEGKGTGLGLATVFGIIRQHNGMIHVYSEKGVGTVFRVYFPLSVEGQSFQDETDEPAPPGGTETILLADDDAAVCGVGKTILRRAGYTVLTAKDGEAAIRLFDEHADEIQLAVLDVVMPKVGGRAVFDHIKGARPQTRVLFASGYSSGGIHSQFILEEGMQFIQKPYDKDDLLRRVRQVLDT